MSAFGGKIAGLRLERVKASPRFGDGAFHNTHVASLGLKKGTALPTIGEYLCGGQNRTPRAPLPIESPLEARSRRSQLDAVVVVRRARRAPRGFLHDTGSEQDAEPPSPSDAAPWPLD